LSCYDVFPGDHDLSKGEEHVSELALAFGCV
jgi:hypothetical protein